MSEITIKIKNFDPEMLSTLSEVNNSLMKTKLFNDPGDNDVNNIELDMEKIDTNPRRSKAVFEMLSTAVALKASLNINEDFLSRKQKN